MECAAEAGIQRREEADRWEEQQARVPNRTPSLDGPFAAELLAQPDPAVEGNPGHHFRVREVAPPAAHLPDPFIWFVPAVFEQPEDLPAKVPGGEQRAHAVCPCLIHRVR